MSSIIPTPEEAAAAVSKLRCNLRPIERDQPNVASAVHTMLPLLEAIAAGRVFEVRPERCAMCGGFGGGYIDAFDEHGNVGSEWEDCPLCGGIGSKNG